MAIFSRKEVREIKRNKTPDQNTIPSAVCHGIPRPRTIEYVKKILPTTEIMVVGPVPHWNPSLPMFLLSKNVRLDKEHIFFNNSIKKLQLIDKSLRIEALNQSVLYLSPIDALCSAENCLATVDYKNEIIPIASDYGHLTEAGSVFLTRILLKE